MKQTAFITEIDLSMIKEEDLSTLQKWFFQTAKWVELSVRKEEWGTVLVLLDQMKIIVTEVRDRQNLSTKNENTDNKRGGWLDYGQM